MHVAQRHPRRLTGVILALALVGTALTTLTLSQAPPAPAAGALSCSSPAAYNLANATGAIYPLNTATAANSAAIGSFGTPPSASNWNGLGISQGGTTAWAVAQNAANTTGTTTVARFDPATGAVTTYRASAPTSGATFVMGAVDPANGVYYYATYVNGTVIVDGFNTTTLSAIGGTIATIPASSKSLSNGDFAFDTSGNLYIVEGAGANASGTTLDVVRGANFPTTGSSTGVALTASVLATLAPVAGQYNGIVIGTDGYLYAQYSSAGSATLVRVDPNTGATASATAETGVPASSGGQLADLASCGYNGSIQVQKNIVSRAAPTDQFGLSITGGGLSSGNAATTSGSSTGLQTGSGEIAGPVVGVPGQAYTISEAGASGAALSNYVTSYTCVDTTSGSTVAAGTATSFALTFPTPGAGAASAASIVCTFTNQAYTNSLSLTKTATSPPAVTGPGQTVTYQFVATNTGQQTLSGVTITDTQAVAGESLATGPTCQSLASPAGTCSGSSTTLLPGQSATFTATFTTTQADVDAGSVQDSATASGTPPGLAPVTSPPANATVPVTADDRLNIDKSVVSPTSSLTLGQVITYSFVVTNTGNQTLSGVSVTDTQSVPGEALTSGPTCESLANPAGTCSGATTSLAPGQSATFTGTYTVTQTDVDAGSVTDSATAAGTPPGSTTPVISPPSNATDPVTPDNSLNILKSVASPPPSPAAAGQVITYSFVVTNTGNQTLSAVGVTDTQSVPGEALTSGPTCESLANPTGTCSGATTLAPGQSATFTGTYTVTQTDVDAGSVTDLATAAGTPPGSTTPVISPPSTAVKTVTPTPATPPSSPPSTTSGGTGGGGTSSGAGSGTSSGAGSGASGGTPTGSAESASPTTETSPSALAFTGLAAMPYAELAAGLLVAGAGLVVLARRRRRRRPLSAKGG